MPGVFQKDLLDLPFEDESTPCGAGVAERRVGWEVDAAVLSRCAGCGAGAIGAVARVAGAKGGPCAVGAVFGMAN